MMELWFTLLPTPMMFPPTTSVGVSELVITWGVENWSAFAPVPCAFAPLSEVVLAPGVGVAPDGAAFAPAPVVELPNEEVPNDEFPNDEFPNEEFPNEEFPNEELPNELPPCALLPKEDCELFPNNEANPPPEPLVANPVPVV